MKTKFILLQITLIVCKNHALTVANESINVSEMSVKVSQLFESILNENNMQPSTSKLSSFESIHFLTKSYDEL